MLDAARRRSASSASAIDIRTCRAICFDPIIGIRQIVRRRFAACKSLARSMRSGSPRRHLTAVEFSISLTLPEFIM